MWINLPIGVGEGVAWFSPPAEAWVYPLGRVDGRRPCHGWWEGTPIKVYVVEGGERYSD